MKIAFFTAPLLNHGGGMEKHFMAMANAMSKKGHKVSIINLDEIFYRRLSIILTLYYHSNQINDLRLSNAEVKSILKNVKWEICGFLRLKEKLKEFDVVYSKNEIIDLLALKISISNFYLPLIVGVHTPIYYPISNSLQAKIHNFLYLGSFYKWLLKKTSCFRVLNYDDEILLGKILGVSKRKIVKILNPIDISFFKDYQEKNKKNDGLFKILFVGRLNQQKGVDFFCEIIKKLSLFEVFYKFKFSIAGSGDAEPLVKEICKKFKNVDYIGQVSQKELPTLYSRQDILVAPSRYETMNWVVLEAQSCGLPVVTSDIPGPREIVINNRTGFMLDYDVDKFTEKILFLYKLKKEKNGLFKKMKIYSRANVVNKFAYKKIVGDLELLFKNTLNEKKR